MASRIGRCFFSRDAFFHAPVAERIESPAPDCEQASGEQQDAAPPQAEALEEESNG